MKLLSDLSGLVIARYGDSSDFGPEPVAHDGQLLYTVPDSVLIPDAVVRVLVEDGKEPEFIADQSSIDYQWKGIKEHRNRLLKDSDWICSVTDYCPPNKEEWIQYRQGLRDISAQPNPFRLVWPKDPSVSVPAPVVEPIPAEPASEPASESSVPASESSSDSPSASESSSDSPSASGSADPALEPASESSSDSPSASESSSDSPSASEPATSDSQPASSEPTSESADPALEPSSEPASESAVPASESSSDSPSASESSVPASESSSEPTSESASEPASESAVPALDPVV